MHKKAAKQRKQKKKTHTQTEKEIHILALHHTHKRKIEEILSMKPGAFFLITKISSDTCMNSNISRTV